MRQSRRKLRSGLSALKSGFIKAKSLKAKRVLNSVKSPKEAENAEITVTIKIPGSRVNVVTVRAEDSAETARAAVTEAAVATVKAEDSAETAADKVVKAAGTGAAATAAGSEVATTNRKAQDRKAGSETLPHHDRRQLPQRKQHLRQSRQQSKLPQQSRKNKRHAEGVVPYTEFLMR